MKKSLIVLSFAALLMFAACSGNDDSSSSASSSSSISSSSESSSTTSSSSSSSSSESSSSSSESSTSSSEEQTVVTAYKNGQQITIEDVKEEGSDARGKYVIGLAHGDRLSLKDGETDLNFYAYDEETQSSVSIGAVYTATVAGDYVVWYNASGQLWTDVPRATQFKLIINDEVTTPTNLADETVSAPGKYVVDLKASDVIGALDGPAELLLYRGADEPNKECEIYTTGQYTIWYNKEGEVWVDGPAAAVVTLSVNGGEAETLKDVRGEGEAYAAKGKYEHSFNYGDVVTMKDGDNQLKLDGDETSLTIEAVGDYVIWYNERAEVYFDLVPAAVSISRNDGEYEALVSKPQKVKGEYDLSLAYHEKIELKDGDNELYFYTMDGETAVKGEKEYVAPAVGEYTVVYDAQGRVFVNGPADAAVKMSKNGGSYVPLTNVKQAGETIKGRYKVNLEPLDEVSFKDGTKQLLISTGGDQYDESVVIPVSGEYTFEYDEQGRVNVTSYPAMVPYFVVLSAAPEGEVLVRVGDGTDTYDLPGKISEEYNLMFLTDAEHEYTTFQVLELLPEQTRAGEDDVNVYRQSKVLDIEKDEYVKFPVAGAYLVGGPQFTRDIEPYWSTETGLYFTPIDEEGYIGEVEQALLFAGAEFRPSTLDLKYVQDDHEAALAGEYDFATLDDGYGGKVVRINHTGYYKIRLTDEFVIEMEKVVNPVADYNTVNLQGNKELVNKVVVYVENVHNSGTYDYVDATVDSEDPTKLSFQIPEDIGYTHFKVYELVKDATDVGEKLANVYRLTGWYAIDLEAESTQIEFPDDGYYLPGNLAFVGNEYTWDVGTSRKMSTDNLEDGELAKYEGIYIAAGSQFKVVYLTPKDAEQWDIVKGLADDYSYCTILTDKDNNIYLSHAGGYYDLILTSEYTLKVVPNTSVVPEYNQYSVTANDAPAGTIFVRAWYGPESEKIAPTFVKANVEDNNISFELNKDIPYTNFDVFELKAGQETYDPDELARKSYVMDLGTEEFEWPVPSTYLYGNETFIYGTEGDAWDKSSKKQLDETTEEGFIGEITNLTVVEGSELKVVNIDIFGYEAWKNGAVVENEYCYVLENTNIYFNKTGVYDLKVDSDYKLHVSLTAEPVIEYKAYSFTADLAPENKVYVHAWINENSTQEDVLATVSGKVISFELNKYIPYDRFIVAELADGKAELDTEWNNVYRQSYTLNPDATEFAWPETGYRLYGNHIFRGDTDAELPWDQSVPVVLEEATGEYVAKVEGLSLKAGALFKLVELDPRGRADHHVWYNAALVDAENGLITFDSEDVTNFKVPEDGIFDFYFKADGSLAVVDKTVYKNYSLTASEAPDAEHVVLVAAWGGEGVADKVVVATVEGTSISFKLNQDIAYEHFLVAELNKGYDSFGEDWDKSVYRQSYDLAMDATEFAWPNDGYYFIGNSTFTGNEGEWTIDSGKKLSVDEVPEGFVAKLDNVTVEENAELIVVNLSKRGKLSYFDTALNGEYTFASVVSNGADGYNVKFTIGGVYSFKITDKGVIDITQVSENVTYTLNFNDAPVNGHTVVVHAWADGLDDYNANVVSDGSSSLKATLPAAYTDFCVVELNDGETELNKEWTNVLRQAIGDVKITGSAYNLNWAGYYFVGDLPINTWSFAGENILSVSNLNKDELARRNDMYIGAGSKFSVVAVDKYGEINWTRLVGDVPASVQSWDSNENVYFTNEGYYNVYVTTNGSSIIINVEAVGKALVLSNYVKNSKEVVVGNDFVLGMDCSSVDSLEKSGVKFYDYDGVERDIYEILAESGVTHVRVRVWVDPFDGESNGYGGGNCDIDTAVAIGKRVTAAGMKLIVDFHYSDFWADPAKQFVPKAWAGYTVEQRATAVAEYTKTSLQKLIDAGVDVDIVQVGNEINGGICGVYLSESYKNMKDSAAGIVDVNGYYSIIKAGTDAVREKLPEARIAVHYTNPQSYNFVGTVEALINKGVDFDIFGTSYYEFYHGKDGYAAVTEKLANVKEKAADLGKNINVMVLETSHPYTLQDTDGHGNQIYEASQYSTCKDEFIPLTQEGQIEMFKKIVKGINDIGGAGVCYWEGAWVTVGLNANWDAEKLAANAAIWGAKGSGWANTAANEYDPEAPSSQNQGSAVDNQAFFDAYGRPLESLRVYAMLRGLNVNQYNLIKNGGFETGDLTNWEITGDLVTDNVQARYWHAGDAPKNTSGVYFVNLWRSNDEARTFTISQTVMASEAGEYNLTYAMYGADCSSTAKITLGEDEVCSFSVGQSAWTSDGPYYFSDICPVNLEADVNYTVTITVNIAKGGWGGLDQIALFK